MSILKMAVEDFSLSSFFKEQEKELEHTSVDNTKNIKIISGLSGKTTHKNIKKIELTTYAKWLTKDESAISHKGALIKELQELKKFVEGAFDSDYPIMIAFDHFAEDLVRAYRSEDESKFKEVIKNNVVTKTFKPYIDKTYLGNWSIKASNVGTKDYGGVFPHLVLSKSKIVTNKLEIESFNDHEQKTVLELIGHITASINDFSGDGKSIIELFEAAEELHFDEANKQLHFIALASKDIYILPDLVRVINHIVKIFIKLCKESVAD